MASQSFTAACSGEDPESLRGPQCEKLWADEIAAWQYPQETWDMATMHFLLIDGTPLTHQGTHIGTGKCGTCLGK